MACRKEPLVKWSVVVAVRASHSFLVQPQLRRLVEKFYVEKAKRYVEKDLASYAAVVVKAVVKFACHVIQAV